MLCFTLRRGDCLLGLYLGALVKGRDAVRTVTRADRALGVLSASFTLSFKRPIHAVQRCSHIPVACAHTHTHTHAQMTLTVCIGVCDYNIKAALVCLLTTYSIWQHDYKRLDTEEVKITLSMVSSSWLMSFAGWCFIWCRKHPNEATCPSPAN